MWQRSQLLHPATIIASIALFVSLGGVTYAAATIGTKQLKTGAVTRAKIKNRAVSASKLANNAVVTEKLATGAVTPTKLRTGAVTAGKLADGAIQTSNLQNGAVTESKLGSGAVSESKIGGGAVTSGKLGAGAVGTAAVADGAITAGKLAAGAAVVGRGTQEFNREQIATGQSATLFTFTGLGQIQASCAAGVATTSFTNSSGTAVNVQAAGVENGAPDAPFVERSNPSSGATVTHTNTGTGGVETITWQVSYTDTTGVDHLVTANLSLGASLLDCVVAGEASYSG